MDLFSRAPLRHLTVRVFATLAFCVGAVAHAASDGLTISGNGYGQVIAGNSYSFTPTTKDPSGRKLVFSITNKPPWASFNSSTGQLWGTPGIAYSPVWYSGIEISVSDGVSTAALAGFGIAVKRPDTSPPVISGTPPTTVNVSSSYSFRPSAKDPAGNIMWFGVTNKPSWASFVSTTGQLAGTPSAANVGTYSNIVIWASDGQRTALLPAFSIQVHASSATADKPVISGTPSNNVTAGSIYKFQPTAKDPDGKTLSFSVQNKPSWASFSISTGLLDGTPTSSQTGTYGNVIVSASNGQYTSALPAFSITVNSQTAATGVATVYWVPPTKNTNGTALTDLAGFLIYYGTSPSSLSHSVQVASATETKYLVSNLAAGMWYFAGRAYTTTGVQSAMSPITSKSIP